MTRSDPKAVHVTWEPERLYWAVVHAPAWRRAGELPPGLRPELADEVPVPPDELHAVCAPAGDGRVIVCAASRSALENLPGEAVTLTPASLPACIGIDDGAVSPGVLNLLVGPHEPVPVRRARRRRHLIGAASVALCSALLALGLVRRAAHWDNVAKDAAAARASVLSRAGLSGGGSEGPHALAAELARLRRRAAASTSVRPAPDAAVALASVLKAWPADVPSRPESLRISQSGATIAVNVDNDPAPFLEAFKPPEGWRAAEPRLNVSGSVTRLMLELTPETAREGVR